MCSIGFRRTLLSGAPEFIPVLVAFTLFECCFLIAPYWIGAIPYNKHRVP